MSVVSECSWRERDDADSRDDQAADAAHWLTGDAGSRCSCADVAHLDITPMPVLRPNYSGHLLKTTRLGALSTDRAAAVLPDEGLGLPVSQFASFSSRRASPHCCCYAGDNRCVYSSAAGPASLQCSGSLKRPSLAAAGPQSVWSQLVVPTAGCRVAGLRWRSHGDIRQQCVDNERLSHDYAAATATATPCSASEDGGVDSSSLVQSQCVCSCSELRSTAAASCRHNTRDSSSQQSADKCSRSRTSGLKGSWKSLLKRHVGARSHGNRVDRERGSSPANPPSSAIPPSSSSSSTAAAGCCCRRASTGGVAAAVTAGTAAVGTRTNASSCSTFRYSGSSFSSGYASHEPPESIYDDSTTAVTMGIDHRGVVSSSSTTNTTAITTSGVSEWSRYVGPGTRRLHVPACWSNSDLVSGRHGNDGYDTGAIYSPASEPDSVVRCSDDCIRSSATRQHSRQCDQEGVGVDSLTLWLQSLTLERFASNLLSAGYDLPTVSRATPEDLLAAGVSEPSARRRMTAALAKLNVSVAIPSSLNMSLEQWLSELRLSQYAHGLQQQGITSVAQTGDIDCEDLEDIGITLLGHQKRLMMAVRRVRELLRHKRRTTTTGQ